MNSKEQTVINDTTALSLELISAAKNGDLPRIVQLVETHNVNVNQKNLPDHYHGEAVVQAAANGHIEVLQYLEHMHAELRVYRQDEFGDPHEELKNVLGSNMTPDLTLMAASEAGQLAVVKYLFEKNYANVDYLKQDITEWNTRSINESHVLAIKNGHKQIEDFFSNAIDRLGSKPIEQRQGNSKYLDSVLKTAKQEQKYNIER